MIEFEAICEKEWGIKERTQKGYAVIICNLYYIYKGNEELFIKLGHPWEEFLYDFLPNVWGPVVKLCHLELTRSDLICKTYVRDVIKVVSRWKIEDVSIRIY